MSFWPVTKRVVKDADIIVLVVDVRMPELSRNKELERIIDHYGKHLVYAFNKIDIVSEDYLKENKEKYKNAFFVSGTKNIGISKLKRGLLIIAQRMRIKEPKIGVVGYPNVGKSAIINALAKRAKAKVSAVPGTTRGIQFIKAGSLLVLDSPGVIPMKDSPLMLAVMGAKNIEKIRDADRVAYKIIEMFVEHDKNVLESVYGIEIEGKDYDLILENIGRKKGFLLKGGVVDIRRVALLVVKDWQSGKLTI